MVRPYIIPHEISHHFLGSSHVRNDKHKGTSINIFLTEIPIVFI